MNKEDQSHLDEVFSAFYSDITKLLAEAMVIGGGAFSKYEIMITYPAINLYLHYLGGVQMGLNESNFIVAISSLRGMVESLASLIYDGTAHMNKREYDKFYKTGRFHKEDSVGKLVEISQRSLIKHMKSATDFDALKVYDRCCSYLHFSTKHVGFMVEKIHGNSKMEIKIGKTDKIPVKLQKELIKACSDATIILHRVILGLIVERKQHYEINE